MSRVADGAEQAKGKEYEPMRPPWAAKAVSLVLPAVSLLYTSGVVHAQGKVYPKPARPYKGFKPHELSFQTPSDGAARDEYRSAPFYAVILRTTKPCSVTEAERLKVQALFPGNKVFSTRFGCEDGIEENITYTNVNPKFGFIAVYAGSTLPQARTFLARVNATHRFPGANIRKMQVVLVYP